ncbi:YaeQ family protein [Vibrio vulnificus]|uniref:YaeQ family protein n=1 Tax=Vibrio vulnificus TaxID=672 RepID=UPI001CDC4397|nr:YaeQ family protein [Vibrio vulnificus]MCA4023030.1 YaeQ family protein [Vibrio vulnificus]
MALKPTIYKFRINLTDINRDHFDTLSITTALHPSEKVERLAARLLAFCLHAQPELVFTKGLSTIEEPDVWKKELDDSIAVWIDVGEPEVDRIKKATRQAKSVFVYSFNQKSSVWWEKHKGKFQQLPVSICQFDADAIEQLANQLQRGSSLSVMISGNSVFIDGDSFHQQVDWQVLQSNE